MANRASSSQIPKDWGNPANKFTITLKAHMLNNNRLTIPASFIRNHPRLLDPVVTQNLILLIGPKADVMEECSLHVHQDGRRSGPSSHVTIQGQLQTFMEKNGWRDGTVLSFELFQDLIIQDHELVAMQFLIVEL